MGIAHRADLLRLDLLDRHGGVWADATCACQTPLDHWLPAVAYRGFFAISRPVADRALSNRFLAGAPGHLLARRWRDAILAYWSGGRTAPDSYTIHHDLFEALLRSDATFRAAWALVPSLPAVPAHLGQHFLHGRIDATAFAALVASGGAPVHKLSRKLLVDPARLDRVFALIEAARSAGP
jgi:mannosyltransferase OCH1-like enzyme